MKAIAAGLAVLSAAFTPAPASARIDAGVQVAGRVPSSCRAYQTADTMVLRCSAPLVKTESVKVAGQTTIVTVAPAI